MALSETSFLLDEILGNSKATEAVEPENASGKFWPREPRNLESIKLSETRVISLVIKYLRNCHLATGQQIAEQICLPLAIVAPILRGMKSDQLVAYRRASGLNDYEHELTPLGHERAQRLIEQSSYFGAAPVSLEDYEKSVLAQSPSHDQPTADDMQRALADLKLREDVFFQLGEAVSSARALFLFGPPGNGKTSIAERVTAAFGPSIWIPRAIEIDGEIVRLFDPTVHIPIKWDKDDEHLSNMIDRRWVEIQRPTVMVGGELTMDRLELTPNKETGISEAPVHLKSNCGTLVIDDFGRQRMSTVDLLNRWIVPLEKQYDFLNTVSGKKIQVPFEQLIVFATNLEPKELVDEAFLRRIPYKIEALDPSEEDFRHIFASISESLGIAAPVEMIDYLIAEHYTKQDRPFRYCHPRDLLHQISNHCRFHRHEMKLTPQGIDSAVKNYFPSL